MVFFSKRAIHSSVQLDMVVMLFQDAVLLSVVSQLCIFADIILKSVESVEKDLAKTSQQESCYKLLFKIMSVDSNFGKTYNSLMTVIMLECFYNALFGFEFTLEFLFSENFFPGPGLIVWSVYQIPLLFLFMHYGDVYEGKVYQALISMKSI